MNLEPGQDVTVSCYIEHAPLARAIARVAYAEGARRVDSYYIDLHLRRERAAHAPDDVVGWTPPWMLQRVKEEAERRTAMIEIVGEPEPDLFAGLDPGRVAQSLMPDLRRATGPRSTTACMPWTIVAFPTPGWAEQVFGEPDVVRLWDAVRGTVRLDEDDPVAAWKAHIAMLRSGRRAERAPFDAVRFRVPGTDLTVGLLPVATGRRQAPRPRGGSSTCRTCRPKRSSRRPTAAGPRGRCGRHSRSSSSAAPSSATWR